MCKTCKRWMWGTVSAFFLSSHNIWSFPFPDEFTVLVVDFRPFCLLLKLWVPSVLKRRINLVMLRCVIDLLLTTCIHQFFSHKSLQVSGWSFTLGLLCCPHLHVLLSVNMTFVLFFLWFFIWRLLLCWQNILHGSRFSARRHPTHCPINHSDTAQLCLFW